MLNKTINAFVEGRGSLASLERSIEEAYNPLMARAEVERELAAELAFKNLFATIPPPSEGLSRVMKALRAAPPPDGNVRQEEAMEMISEPLRAMARSIPEPMGGYSAALARLKAKLAAAPAPMRIVEAERDIQPGFDAMPAAGTSAISERKKGKRTTQKIVRLPMRPSQRDVLAAGKDLPEDPNDLPDA